MSELVSELKSIYEEVQSFADTLNTIVVHEASS